MNNGLLRTIVILTSLMLSSSAFASLASDMPTNDQLVVGLSAGPTWITGNKTQTIFLDSDLEKTYTGDNSNNSFPTAEIFVGMQRSLAAVLRQPVLGQLGISVVGAGDANLNGDIWDDADSTFDNSNYSYKVNHTHVAIKGRLIGDFNFVLQPYISVSAGVGFNHTYDFSIQPKISEEVPAPPFGSNTKTSFTYTVGIGFQKSFDTHLQAAIGYEFADWGQTQLSRAQGQTVNQGLSLNHLYANQLQLSLFYID